MTHPTGGPSDPHFHHFMGRQPDGTVKAHLHRARGALSHVLSPESEEDR